MKKIPVVSPLFPRRALGRARGARGRWGVHDGADDAGVGLDELKEAQGGLAGLADALLPALDGFGRHVQGLGEDPLGHVEPLAEFRDLLRPLLWRWCGDFVSL